MERISRDAAIKALLSLEEQAFGHDKGSGEHYSEWAATQGLCEPWDGQAEGDEFLPPGFFELLLAVGVSPQEIIQISGINPKCFPAKMCRAYGFAPVRKERK